jgi:hypothetical protein
MKIARKAKPTSPISSIVIQIAVMRIWHELDPAWAFNNQCLARRVLRAKRIGIPIPRADYV